MACYSAQQDMRAQKLHDLYLLSTRKFQTSVNQKCENPLRRQLLHFGLMKELQKENCHFPPWMSSFVACHNHQSEEDSEEQLNVSLVYNKKQPYPVIPDPVAVVKSVNLPSNPLLNAPKKAVATTAKQRRQARRKNTNQQRPYLSS